jgi:hypothetical protein
LCFGFVSIWVVDSSEQEVATMSTDPLEPTFNTDSGFPEPTYTGHEVLDEHSNHVGKVVDVIYEGDSGLSAPTWLIVDPGVLRAPHYVPVAGSYRTEDGAIVVPWDKDWIKSAVKASGDHVLTDADRAELETHYTLTS